jgi:hypothetical protein
MINPRDMKIVTDIKGKYGHVIDLDKSPMAIIEIIHNFQHLVDALDGPGGTGGGPAGPPPPAPDGGTALMLNLLLELKREVAALSAKIR